MTRLALLGLTLCLGCGGLRVAKDRAGYGNLLALTQDQQRRADRREERRDPAPIIILVEQGGVRGLDPVSALERWWQPVHAVGHPVATSTTVYVPTRGHRLVALDRSTGVRRWEIRMPGEAITGLSAADSWVVVSVIDHRRGRSRLVGLSAHDGHLQWMRRSELRFGKPAAVGRVALAPLGDQIVAFRLGNGWERARVDLPPDAGGDDRPAGAPVFEQILLRKDALLVGRGLRWVDLYTATGGQTSALQTIDDAYADAFVLDDGIDAGLGDRDRLRLWVEFSKVGGAPRHAVLLCRRAVVSFRLGPSGRATLARWSHVGKTELEYVSMDVGAEHVTLIREDGLVLRLDRETGRELDRIGGGKPTRGALVLDVDGSAIPGAVPGAKPKALTMQLLGLLLDPDPRLLPAQKLAADVLWRDASTEPRDVVRGLAAGELRPEATGAAEELRAHALDLVSGPWGRPDDDEAQALLASLTDRPSFLDDRRPPAALLARAAVKSGHPAMIAELDAHLMHPATPSTDLAAIVDSLAQLHRPSAVESLARFVRRYHADGQVVYESRAMHRAVDALAHEGEQGSTLALTVLREVASDPFTEASLRSYIALRLEPSDDRTNPSQVSHPRL